MSVRDDELMPVQCDGCDLLTFEPQYCEECAEEGRTARFCSSSACRDHANEHEPRDLLVAHMAEQRRHLTDLFEDDDGFDLLRLRVVDPDLPFTDQCRRLLDKLFRDFASARSALDAKDARLMEAYQRIAVFVKEADAFRSALDEAKRDIERLWQSHLARSSERPTGE